MPLYRYAHPEYPIVIDVVQSMKEPHVHVDEEGVEWRRVFTVPQASQNTKVDAFSSNEFVNKTEGKGMTVGQLWDESNQLSEKREKVMGKDPVKENYFKNYSKKRRGTKHPKDNS